MASNKFFVSLLAFYLGSNIGLSSVDSLTRRFPRALTLEGKIVSVSSPKEISDFPFTRTLVRDFFKSKYNCFLFGNHLDYLEKETNFFLNRRGYALPLDVPPNFLEKHMDIHMVVSRGETSLSVFQKYNHKDILLLKKGVALGREGYSTPKGQFYLQRIVSSPVWYPPKWANVKGPQKPGKDNAYGIWMSELSTLANSGNYHFSVEGDSKLRIHSTNEPSKTEGYFSHGCIRMHPNIAEELFPALLHYTPHKEGRKNSRGTIYPLDKPIPLRIE